MLKGNVKTRLVLWICSPALALCCLAGISRGQDVAVPAMMPSAVATGAASAENVIYVDGNAAGPTHDGSSWCSAFTDLQDGLDRAADLATATEIRIAKGVYVPGRGSEDRNSTFQLTSNLSLVGGFAGCGETDPDLRDFDLFGTVLSGDLLGNDGPNFQNNGDNASVILTVVDVQQVNLDGLTITGSKSYTNGIGAITSVRSEMAARDCDISFNESYSGVSGTDSKLTFQNCWVSDNRGTGVECRGPDTLFLYDCNIINNGSDLSNGGVIADHIVAKSSDIKDNQGFGLSTSDAFLDNCQIFFNRSVGVISDGAAFVSKSYISRNGTAGFFVRSGRLTVKDSEIFDNGYFLGYGGVTSNSADTFLAFDNCYFFFNESTGNGGAIFTEGNQLSIHDCIFAGNSAIRKGGAIYATCQLGQNCESEISDSGFYGNTAELGGAMWVDTGTTNLRNCVFQSNRADDGGALYNPGDSTITNSEFRFNDANRSGGAIAAGGSITVTSSFFNYNRAAFGGVYAPLTAPSIPPGISTWDSCRMNYNTAVVSGGAIYNDDMDMKISNSSFSFNSSVFGGAISQVLSLTGSLRVSNSTLTENSATSLGGAIIGGASTTIENSILWKNETGLLNPLSDENAQLEGGEFATINYSIVQGWTGLFGGVGNFDDDPLILGYDTTPAPGSPAIDAGDPNFVAILGKGDVNGHSRVLCGRVDIGAHEVGIGDFDCDGVVTLSEVAQWFLCASGPIDTPLGQTGCEAYDFNADGKIDLSDYAALQVLPNLQPAR